MVIQCFLENKLFRDRKIELKYLTSDHFKAEILKIIFARSSIPFITDYLFSDNTAKALIITSKKCCTRKSRLKRYYERLK